MMNGWGNMMSGWGNGYSGYGMMGKHVQNKSQEQCSSKVNFNEGTLTFNLRSERILPPR